MAYRDFWQELIDLVRNSATNTDYTQAEIDDNIATAFSVFADYTQDAGTIPNDFKRRKRDFYDPVNLLQWLRDAGIPISSTIIHRHVGNRGDIKYTAYISATS